MSEWWAQAVVAGAVLLTGVCLLLAGVGLASFRRLGHGRLLLVALAFVAFAAQGAYLAYLAYERRADVATGTAGELPILVGADLATVLVLYLAVMKR